MLKLIIGQSPPDPTRPALASQDSINPLNFFKGASLNDPHGLFNAGLDAKAMRSIDIHEGDDIDEPALQDLIRAAVALNAGGKKK